MLTVSSLGRRVIAVSAKKIRNASAHRHIHTRTHTVFAKPQSTSSILIPQVEQEPAFNTEVMTVHEEDGGKRLDAFLGGRMPEQSRSYFGGLCQLGMVLVGGKKAKKSAKVEAGQEVEVRFIISPELSLQGEDIPLDVSTTAVGSRCV